MPVEGLPPAHYLSLVSRVVERPRVGIWAWGVRDPLPEIPVPVLEGDPDATLNMKAILDEVYDAGGYSNFIYSGPPEPRLSPDDAAWAANVLK